MRPWARPPTACRAVLAFNGLRIGEATGLNVEDLDHDGFYLVLRFVREWGRLGHDPPRPPCSASPPTAPTGPMFVNRAGRLVDQRQTEPSSTEPSRKLRHPAPLDDLRKLGLDEPGRVDGLASDGRAAGDDYIALRAAYAADAQGPASPTRATAAALPDPKGSPSVNRRAGPSPAIPPNTTLAPKLTSRVLGQFIALAEHNVFTQSTIWRSNSFDQCAVEPGKASATRIAGELESPIQLDQRPDPLLPPSPNAGVTTRSSGSGCSSARGRLGSLGPVHSLVGVGDQICGLRGRAIGESHGDAEADGHFTIVDDHGLAERHAQTTHN
jgi:hypothetical protein